MSGSLAQIAFTVFLTTLTCTNPILAETLLPSQDTEGFFTANMCQDRQVLSIIGSSIDAVLHTKSILRKGCRLITFAWRR
jgi:hypothetical protein